MGRPVRRTFIFLKQAEIHFDTYLHGHWQTIFHSWRKAPCAYSFDGFFIQAHTERAAHLNVPRTAIWADDQQEHDAPLKFSPPCFLGVLGFRIENEMWCAHSAPDLKRATSNAAVLEIPAALESDQAKVQALPKDGLKADW